MSELKFKNKYRIPSNRLKNWDYSNNAAYFITICTQNREHYFGKIKNGEMHLNELGENATRFWLDIPKHFPFIELGNFVVMPNHTHGILIIDKTTNNTNGCDITENVVGNGCNGGNGAVGRDDGDVDTPNLGVSTAYQPHPFPSHDSSTIHISTIKIETEKPKNGGKNEQWKPGTIGVIINQYKRIVTINNRKINPKFKWQSNYHDHIIRNSFSFENIQNYIEKNPIKWNEDKFY
jgi:putative transposase